MSSRSFARLGDGTLIARWRTPCAIGWINRKARTKVPALEVVAQGEGHFFDNRQRLPRVQVEMRMMFRTALKAYGDTKLPLPELSAHGDTGVPISTPGPKIAKFKNLAGHPVPCCWNMLDYKSHGNLISMLKY
jgi:hypothetical protein